MSTEIILIAATVGSAAIPIVVWLARIRVSQRLVVAGVVGLWTTVPVALAITATNHRESVVEQAAPTAWTMGWPDARTTSGGDWTIPYLAFMLRDPYDAVRYIAARSLGRQPGFEGFRFDTLASPESRDLVSRNILGIWNARQTAGQHHPSLLQTPDGQINEREFQRLLELRDHRIVNLAE